MVQRKYYRKTYQKNKKKRKLFFAFRVLGISFLFLVFCFLLVFIYYAKDLPRPEKFTERQSFQSTKIYDRTGEVLLYEIYGEEKRTIISLDNVSEYLKQAVIVAEDANFYQHFGIDLKGIARAILADLKLGKPAQGASTIPQQLIRSSFLTREKTIERKIREIVLSLELDRRYSKEQILGWYLNQVPFGENAYGAEAASQTYFNKSCRDLSLAEAAVLASLVRAPSYLSPYGENKDRLLIRKNYILDRLVEKGYLSLKQVEEAKKEKLKFAEVRQPIKAPHFVMMVKSYLEEEYGEDFLRERGLKVYTSLNWELQEFAEEMIKEKMESNQVYQAFNAALAAINPNNGEILTLVGSKDWYSQDSYPEGCTTLERNCLFEPKFNIATLGERQPGSAFKPFVYAAAFEKGYTPDTVLWDVKTEFNLHCRLDSSEEKDQYGLDCYHPGNYDEKFRGLVTFRKALAQSLNLPSVKILYLTGIENTIKTAGKLGISTLKGDYGLSLVLGGGEVKLLEMVSAYGVFAAEGLRVPPVSILKIEDSKGNIIEENKKSLKRVLSVEACRLINDILSDNESRAPMFGKKSVLYFEDFEVAAKTGTTQNFNDAWTLGYTPSVAVGVWVGNNSNSPMSEKPGVVLAGPIWREIIKKALVFYPSSPFVKPEPILTEKPVLNGEIDETDPHSLLHFINKDDPQGELPSDPSSDPQYRFWEKGLKNWLKKPE